MQKDHSYIHTERRKARRSYRKTVIQKDRHLLVHSYRKTHRQKYTYIYNIYIYIRDPINCLKKSFVKSLIYMYNNKGDQKKFKFSKKFKVYINNKTGTKKKLEFMPITDIYIYIYIYTEQNVIA